VGGSGRGEVGPTSRPPVKPGNAGNALVNRCAVIRDESADSQPVAAAQSVNDISPGYRIVHDDETLEFMQELAQYSDEYDTITHTTASNDTATTSLDSHAVV